MLLEKSDLVVPRSHVEGHIYVGRMILRFNPTWVLGVSAYILMKSHMGVGSLCLYTHEESHGCWESLTIYS